MVQSSPAVSAKSFECFQAVSSIEGDTSRNLGWTSLLLDRHVIEGRGDYTSLPTPDQTIVLTVSGSFAFDVQDRGRWHHSLRGPGSLGLRRGGDVTRGTFDLGPAGGTAEMLILYLPHALLSSTQDHLGRIGQRWSEPAFNAVAEMDPAVTQMMLSLQRAAKTGVDNMYAESAAVWLAVHLCTTKALSGPDLREPGTLSDRRLNRVLELIDAHFDRPISLTEMASEACISRFHFARVFREKVGVSPHAYISGVRLDTACRLLAASDLAVSEIAARCSFATAARFSAAFRARHGMTPTAYRVAARSG